MKKFIALLLAAMMLFSVTAFADNDTPAEVAEEVMEENIEAITGEDSIVESLIVTEDDDDLIEAGVAAGTPISITVDVPEGYTMTVETDDPDELDADFWPNDGTGVYYELLIAYSEEFGDYTLNDLSDEEYAQMVEWMTGDFNNATVDTSKTTGYGTKLVVVDENGAESDYGFILTIYHGYFIEVNMLSLDNTDITEDEIQTGIDILTSLAFVTE